MDLWLSEKRSVRNFPRSRTLPGIATTSPQVITTTFHILSIQSWYPFNPDLTGIRSSLA
jgi:hypothetical protein